MTDNTDIIIVAMMGANAAIFFLCSLILLRGGLIPFGEQHNRPSKIQITFFWPLFLSQFLSFPTS